MAMSEEHKAKMAAGREAAKLRKQAAVVADEPAPDNEVIPRVPSDDEPVQPTPPVQPQTVISQDDLTAMLEYIKTLESNSWRNQSQQQGPQVQNGRMTGTTTKYAMTGYPDPSARLAAEPRLARFAFSENYEIRFVVNSSEYTTIDNVRMREPKFEIELDGIIFDEETGEPTTKRYICRKFIMHEDPDTALILARENGINVEGHEEADFLNEMRYLRIRSWLLDYFYPRPIIQDRSSTVDTVIGGQIVQMFEINSADHSSNVDFTRMDKAKKLR